MNTTTEVSWLCRAISPIITRPYPSNRMRISATDLWVFIRSKSIQQSVALSTSECSLCRHKPMVPERDSSLYESFPSSQNAQGYQTFRPFLRECSSALSVPNLTSLTDLRRNSNSSSNEADEESSLSSLNSNHVPSGNAVANEQINDENVSSIYMIPSLSTSVSTFKATSLVTPLPSKPSDVKRRSNNRKQIYGALNSNNNNNNNNNNTSSMISENDPCAPSFSSASFSSSSSSSSSSSTAGASVAQAPPPPPPPFPVNFDLLKRVAQGSPAMIEKRPLPIRSDFQSQIEEAKNRLKKVDGEATTGKGLLPSKANDLLHVVHQCK